MAARPDRIVSASPRDDGKAGDQPHFSTKAFSIT
jgi:hypothetical protein